MTTNYRNHNRQTKSALTNRKIKSKQQKRSYSSIYTNKNKEKGTASHNRLYSQKSKQRMFPNRNWSSKPTKINNRRNLSAPSVRQSTIRPLKMASIGCPETSVNYQHTLRNNPEERRPRVLLDTHCVLWPTSWSVHSTLTLKTWQHLYKISARNMKHIKMATFFSATTCLWRQVQLKCSTLVLLHASVLELTRFTCAVRPTKGH